jgi:hypothetical protein
VPVPHELYRFTLLRNILQPTPSDHDKFKCNPFPSRSLHAKPQHSSSSHVNSDEVRLRSRGQTRQWTLSNGIATVYADSPYNQLYVSLCWDLFFFVFCFLFGERGQFFDFMLI